MPAPSTQEPLIQTLSELDEDEGDDMWLLGPSSSSSSASSSSSVLSRSSSSLSEAEDEGEVVEDPEDEDAEEDEDTDKDSFSSSSPPLSSSRGRPGRRRTPTLLGSLFVSSQGVSAMSRSRSRSDSVGTGVRKGMQRWGEGRNKRPASSRKEQTFIFLIHRC